MSKFKYGITPLDVKNGGIVKMKKSTMLWSVNHYDQEREQVLIQTIDDDGYPQNVWCNLSLLRLTLV